MAIQGKNAFKYFTEWSCYSIDHLKSFGCEYRELDKFLDSGKVFFAKTGYTGEDGLEILLPKKISFKFMGFF